MEGLAEETWDLVIAGTSLVQALLALSLSRSDLKILHVDQNSYYGGVDAGLSLEEARLWAERHNDESGSSTSARILQRIPSNPRLAASRAYTLSLYPQIVYAQSTFLPSLVSSKINTQLEFLAVGAWWVYKEGKLQKVPSSREDVFADEGLSRRDKIGLMKFLRYVVRESSEEAEAQEDVLRGSSLQSALTTKFKISPDLQLPISALALAQQSVHDTEVETAVSRIRRHMKSMGYFGPGFGAVIAKYAGNAEVAQVCCRACAVGGATYLLGHGISDVVAAKSQDTVEVTLDNGTTVKAKHVVGSVDDLPKEVVAEFHPNVHGIQQTCHSISIVSSSLPHLFPQTSDNGPVPAAAIVLVADTGDIDQASTHSPIYLQIHSEDTGECPPGQCIVYASVLHSKDTDVSATYERLTSAVHRFLDAPTDSDVKSENPTGIPEVIWSMSYVSAGASLSKSSVDTYKEDNSGRVLAFLPLVQDIAFDDSVLNIVKAAWERILGEAAHETEFMRFEDRSVNQGGDE